MRADSMGRPRQPDQEGGPSQPHSPAGAGLDLRAHGGDTLLRVRATPKASRTEVLGVSDGALRIRIQAPPVDGAANQAVRDFLAGLLGRPRTRLSLERGAANRDKVFRIEGMDPAAVAAALVARLPGAR
jgi:uncharacterized protein (TIGR00251 family)